MSLRLDGYVRVSRVGGREGEGYIAPKIQREAIEAYAEELGGKIVAWHDDQDHTGGTMDRPGFEAMLERLRAGESDGVVVMRIDRFARSVADGSSIVREVVERGQVFASCYERIDPRTPEGKYTLNGFLNNAELFLNQAKVGWWTAKSRAVARGVHIGPTPVGYQREKSQPLNSHPTYGPAITTLFAHAATRKTDSDLARWMSDRAPRAGGAPWQSSEIRRWLENRVYLGEVRYGDLVNPEAHPPLTDAETWEASQRTPGVQRRPSDSTYLLSGLVRCAACRYSMAPARHGGADGATPVYRCGKGGKRACPEPSVITGAILEEHVLHLALDRLRGLQLEAASDGVDLAALDDAYSDAEAELRAFAADVNARRVLGEDGWQESLSARVAARDGAREARDQAYSRNQLVAVRADVVEDLDHDGLRDLLRGMVRTLFIRRRPRGADVSDRVLAVWSDDDRLIDVPGPHRSGPFEPIRW